MGKAKLTIRQATLLAYPPGFDTWLCGKHNPPLANSGDRADCWHCRGKKGKKPRLLWPDYEKACIKAGVPADRKPRRYFLDQVK